MNVQHLYLARHLAFQEFHDRATLEGDFRAYSQYVRKHRIDSMRTLGFAGAMAVLQITTDRHYFDFADPGQEVSFPAFVIEAFGEDGKTTTDLVAWPLHRPDRVCSMFGRVGLLNEWAALNPASYFLGEPMPLHRTPLEWLQAGCEGSAIVVPRLAAQQIQNLPGRVAARDMAHGQAVQQLLVSALVTDRIVVPEAGRVAA